MTRTTILLVSGAVSALLLLLGRSAQAARVDVDALAADVQRQSEDLLQEFRSEFSLAPQFSQLAADAYELHRLASHIRAVVQRGSSLTYAQSDIPHLRDTGADAARLVFEAERGASQGQFGNVLDVRAASLSVRGILDSMSSTVSQLDVEIKAILRPAYVRSSTVYYSSSPVYFSSPMLHVTRPAVRVHTLPRPRSIGWGVRRRVAHHFWP